MKTTWAPWMLSGKDNTEKNLALLLEQLKDYQSTYSNAHTLLKNAELVIQQTLNVVNSSLIGSNYTEAQLNTHYSTVNAQLTAVRSTITSLEAAQRALESAKQANNGESQSVISARAAYENTLRQLEANEVNARQALEQAKNQLASAEQSAALSKNSAKSAIDSSFGQYDQARINQGKLSVNIPFSGQILDVMVKVGQEVNPGTPLFTIQDDDVLKIVTYLTADDIERIKVGDSVLLGNGEKATIASIAPGADSVTKKYKVEFLHQSEALSPGTFLKVTFQTASDPGDSRLFVPLNALHILPNENYVWTVQADKAFKAPVTFGNIVGDLVEIMNGLSVGDVLITEGGRLIEHDGTELTLKP
ncbi:efflux RND transporter periplasmic adaptor subunit [Candidatus Peregrinibacteria bacterium]|nr:MAG: efflux RND transporter periplasmic adaptor subunit [Candidatus Peregrinibacteria bacterium]